MKSIAVILAGGSGERFGSETPKQFVKLAGRKVIEYTLDAFDSHKDIDEIIIVAKSQQHDTLWKIVSENRYKKISKIINAGEDRFGSTYSAIVALSEEDSTTKILLHDAVRPLIDEKSISDSIAALDLYDAVDTVIDATDTIVKVDDENCVVDIPDRKYMKRGLTPQGFRLGVLRRAYDLAINKNRRQFTCDCGVVKAMLPDVKIAAIKSSEKNIKITYPIDLHIVEKYIHMGIERRLSEYDLQDLADKSIVVFGGHSGIGAKIVEIAREHGADVTAVSRKDGVDVSNPTSIANFFNNIDKLDICINASAILTKKPLDFFDIDEIDYSISTNYNGAVYIAYYAKKLLENSQGVLINFTSSSYTRGRANYALYSSSKAAIVNLTQALSGEWKNIRVNCINPERTKTPMREKNFGVEPAETLLDASKVATRSLKLALSPYSGMILDVKRDI